MAKFNLPGVNLAGVLGAAKSATEQKVAAEKAVAEKVASRQIIGSPEAQARRAAQGRIPGRVKALQAATRGAGTRALSVAAKAAHAQDKVLAAALAGVAVLVGAEATGLPHFGGKVCLCGFCAAQAAARRLWADALEGLNEALVAREDAKVALQAGKVAEKAAFDALADDVAAAGHLAEANDPMLSAYRFVTGNPMDEVPRLPNPATLFPVLSGLTEAINRLGAGKRDVWVPGVEALLDAQGFAPEDWHLGFEEGEGERIEDVLLVGGQPVFLTDGEPAAGREMVGMYVLASLLNGAAGVEVAEALPQQTFDTCLRQVNGNVGRYYDKAGTGALWAVRAQTGEGVRRVPMGAVGYARALTTGLTRVRPDHVPSARLQEVVGVLGLLAGRKLGEAETAQKPLYEGFVALVGAEKAKAPEERSLGSKWAKVLASAWGEVHERLRTARQLVGVVTKAMTQDESALVAEVEEAQARIRRVKAAIPTVAAKAWAKAFLTRLEVDKALAVHLGGDEAATVLRRVVALQTVVAQIPTLVKGAEGLERRFHGRLVTAEKALDKALAAEAKAKAVCKADPSAEALAALDVAKAATAQAVHAVEVARMYSPTAAVRVGEKVLGKAEKALAAYRGAAKAAGAAYRTARDLGDHAAAETIASWAPSPEVVAVLKAAQAAEVREAAEAAQADEAKRAAWGKRPRRVLSREEEDRREAEAVERTLAKREAGSRWRLDEDDEGSESLLPQGEALVEAAQTALRAAVQTQFAGLAKLLAANPAGKEDLADEDTAPTPVAHLAGTTPVGEATDAEALVVANALASAKLAVRATTDVETETETETAAE